MTENGMMNTNNTVCGANHDGAMSLAAPGDYGVACYRIPALAEAPNGWILAAFDARPHNCPDADIHATVHLVGVRVHDFGPLPRFGQTPGDGDAQPRLA